MKQEQSRTDNKRHAEALLRQRIREVDQGIPDPTRARQTTLESLIDRLRRHYSLEGLRSADRMERATAHLVRHFKASHPVADIDYDAIDAYKVHRKDEGAANATINRELAMLKQSFRLGMDAGEVFHMPAIKLLEEDNARSGFFKRAEYEAILVELPPAVQPVIQTAYITGWRKGEILSREWRHVDFDRGTLCLDRTETKNKTARVFPFSAHPELEAILVGQKTRTEALERALERRIPTVFHRENGAPIKTSARRGRTLACVLAIRDATFTTSGAPRYGTSSTPAWTAPRPKRL